MTPLTLTQTIPPEFFETHRDLFLYDAFHQLKAFLLFPPTACSCKDKCKCDALRTAVALALNTDAYNNARKSREDLNLLCAMRFLWKIPDAHYYQEEIRELYPPQFIEQAFTRREEQKHFQMVYRLVWALLRLGKTYEASYYKIPQASLKDALEILLGETPLKRKDTRGKDYLGGEKAHLAQFHYYKPVCHFIAAIELFKKQYPGKNPLLAFYEPFHIEAILKTAYWIRKELLRLHTVNIKGRTLFAEEVPLSLPAWLEDDNAGISLEPFEDKLQEIKDLFENALLITPQPRQKIC